MNEVAAVILNLNGREWLAACLSSLSRSTIPVDILVADNGSTDDSLAWVQKHFPQARAWQVSAVNVGFAEGYNRALAQAPNPWLALVNNDATLEPTWLEILLHTAAQHPQAAILGGKLLFANTPGRILQSAGANFTDAGSAFEIGWGQPDQGQYDQAGPVAAIPGAALLIRRQVFFELGGFDAAYFAYLEDVDLCWKAWLAGYEVRYAPAAVAFHRYGASGGGRAAPFRIQWMQRNRLANMLKHLETGTLLRALPVSLGYDAYRVLEYARRGQGAALRALLTGRLAFWRDLPRLRAQRAQLQRRRRRSDQALQNQGLLVSALTAFREYQRLQRLAAP